MIDPRYSFYASSFLDEIRSSISIDEKEHLKELFVSLTRSGEIDKWIEENYPGEVLKFAQQTPQNRKKKKKWNKSRDHFLLLSFYAYMILEKGKYLIDSLSSQPEHGAYRNIVVSFGQLFLELSAQKIPNSFFD